MAIGGWTFNAGAANYSFSNNRVLEFTGAGITIIGGGATIANNGELYFRNASSAGSASITNSSFTEFHGTSTAGSAAITNTGTLLFYDNSTAGSATITNNSGLINFHGDSTAGSASITNNASLSFYDNSKAGSATITNRNSLIFYDSSSADGATIINESSLIFRGFSTAATATITTASGATTQFIAAGSSAGARFITQFGGVVDISDPTGHATMSAGSIEGAGNYLIGAKQFTVGSNDLSTEVSGVISGAGGALVKTGTGTLTLTGTNTYTGRTTISAGALQIGNGGTTGSIAGSIANEAQLIFNRSDAVDFSGMISGTGALTKLGAGTLTLTGENNYSGGTTIAGGAISIEKEGKLGNVSGALTLDGGVLQVTGTALAGLTRDIVFGANGGGFDIVEAGHSFTVTQSFSGPGSLSKAGAGTLVLSGTHDYSGATSVLGGRLVSDTAAGLSPNSDYTIAAGAVLEATGGGGVYGVGSLAGAGEVVIGTGSVLVTGSTNATTTFSGSFSGGGSLEYNGTGTQIYTGTGSLGGGLSVCSCGVGGGSFVIRGGSLTLGDFVMVSSGTLVIDQGGRLDAGGNGLLVASALRIDGAGTRVTVADTFVQGFSIGPWVSSRLTTNVSDGPEGEVGSSLLGHGCQVG
ncbi:autotransporter-associated beta strand repeat-containing protein [Bosea rubneri]|uniref:Autotransporter-associated beta strand repeat-containing protein n=1 Tax=Bosea rubneri TaxID=3075434 RepID=A0ABU3SAC6_9HYPH|nr:autotransporter-associated beta strand repeat-containing protein [Bosea sp. ZW T0_25]MDU0341738.1 autotransporter-associated beta strand repeat-containing protein [Bosea sp. ZW T0_25]